VEQARDRVGMLCDQLSRFPDLHDIIRNAGADKELDGLLAALGGAGELDQERMLAWLQAIEDACARKGLAGITSREHGFRPLPAGLSATSNIPVWVCPRGRCDRVVLPEEAQTPPVCAVTGGTPMMPFALPPS
jgi:hypothetical protein